MRKELWAVLVIVAAAFGLRLYRLGALDLWYDEVYSVLISRSLQGDWNPPLYFAFLNRWMSLFGTSEFSLRFPSLLFSALSVPCLYALGKRLFNARVGVYACGLLCLSGFHLWYAQEARPYSLSILLSVLSTYYFYRFITGRRLGSGLLFAAFSVLGLYANIAQYHLFLLGVQFLAALIFAGRQDRVKLFALFCAIGLMFSPHLAALIPKLSYVKDGFWIPRPTPYSLLVSLENFNLGYCSSILMYRITDLVVLAVLVPVFISLPAGEDRKKLLFVLLLAFLPMALSYVFSRLFFPVYLDRGLIIFSPFYYLLLAYALGSAGNRLWKHAAGVVLLLAMGAGIFDYHGNRMQAELTHHYGVIPKRSYRIALRFIEKELRPGDLIVHTNLSTFEVFRFYARDGGRGQRFVFVRDAVDSNWLRPYAADPENVRVEEVERGGAQRIWLVCGEWQRARELDAESRAVKNEFDGKYRLDLTGEFDGIWIFRYSAPAEKPPEDFVAAAQKEEQEGEVRR